MIIPNIMSSCLFCIKYNKMIQLKYLKYNYKMYTITSAKLEPI